MHGKILWYDRKKGYGFIATSEGKDVFVHHTGISANGPKTFYEGDNVSFEIVAGERGPKADDVRIDEEASEQTDSE